MPITYRIDHGQRLIVTTCSGIQTSAEVESYFDTLYKDSLFDPDFDQLLDMSEQTQITSTPDELKRIARSVPYSGNGRRAFVATSDLIYGMCRMYQIFLDKKGENVRVFRDYADACGWLHVDPHRHMGETFTVQVSGQVSGS